MSDQAIPSEFTPEQFLGMLCYALSQVGVKVHLNAPASLLACESGLPLGEATSLFVEEAVILSDQIGESSAVCFLALGYSTHLLSRSLGVTLGEEVSSGDLRAASIISTEAMLREFGESVVSDDLRADFCAHAAESLAPGAIEALPPEMSSAAVSIVQGFNAAILSTLFSAVPALLRAEDEGDEDEEGHLSDEEFVVGLLNALEGIYKAFAYEGVTSMFAAGVDAALERIVEEG